MKLADMFPFGGNMREYDQKKILNTIKMRHLAMASTRKYFAKEGFLEIDSAQLISANCIETHIDPVSVTVNLGPQKKVERYLHTSPEVYHKRLLSYGAEKIYQLGHVFRDGEIGKLHTPEFSLLEWYRSKAVLKDLIADCEKLFSSIAIDMIGTTKVKLANDRVMDLAKQFDQRTMEDLWIEFAGINLRSILKQMKDGNEQALVEKVRAMGLPLRDQATFEDAFHYIMMTKVEPNIGNDRPCVVLKWPIQLAALAKPCAGDLLFADRFEIYAGQMELANAFQELIDPEEQLIRFKDDLNARSELGKSDLPINDHFLNDLEFMPEAAGIAVGFDRLLMLILRASRIDQVLAFSWIKS